MDLLSLKPHKVSQDLSGYITYIYGRPKTGKTTLATQAPNALLLAFERGYNALPGVIAQDITSWSEMRQVYRELKKPEVKERFKTLVVDTVDIASDLCQKYICNQNGIETLGDLGYGKGWSAFKSEFDEVFRGLTQLGYAVIFISHAKEQTIKDERTQVEVTKILPTVQSSSNAIIENMADIYGYAHQSSVQDEDGRYRVVLTLRSNDDSVRCGCRFKHIDQEVDFNYDALVAALQRAIEKIDNNFVTEERNQDAPAAKEYDFDKMMTEVQDLIGQLMTKNQSNAQKITAVIEKYLGKGKKVSDCTPTQCEQIELVIIDLKDLLA